MFSFVNFQEEIKSVSMLLFLSILTDLLRLCLSRNKIPFIRNFSQNNE